MSQNINQKENESRDKSHKECQKQFIMNVKREELKLAKMFQYYSKKIWETQNRSQNKSHEWRINIKFKIIS